MEFFNRYSNYGEKTEEKISRRNAHEKGVPHKVFHLWIINSNNQILVQQRSAQKDSGANLWYVSVGGHIEYNEPVEHAIQRETMEELGINIEQHMNKLQYLYSFYEQIRESDEHIDREFYDVFALKHDISLDSIVMQESEVQAVKYMDYANFKENTLNRHELFVPHAICYQLLAVALENLFDMK